jgi:hypothetical protein
MLAAMVLWSPIMFTAVFGALSPGVAHGEEARGTAMAIVVQVTQLGKAGEHADAAELAAAGVAREDFGDAERVGLAGLAAQSFELSYQAGGPLTDLCGVAAVMRLAAPLDTAAGGALKLVEAEKAEARLERAAGAEWRAVCGLAPVSNPEREVPRTGAMVTPREVRAAQTRDRTPREVNVAPTRDRRRIWAGVGTLVPGLVLLAPTAALLARRGAAERALWAMQGDGDRLTDAESEQAMALRQRYRATTVGAAVLGAAGAALAVTGVVLLATGGRRTRVAVAPWWARGVGGLVFEGRF